MFLQTNEEMFDVYYDRNKRCYVTRHGNHDETGSEAVEDRKRGSNGRKKRESCFYKSQPNGNNEEKRRKVALSYL
jgi:hypothetical protein